MWAKGDTVKKAGSLVKSGRPVPKVDMGTPLAAEGGGGGRLTSFQAILYLSGFGWDEENKVPTAPDKVWDEYLLVIYLAMFI
jgi:hypothetical protein